MNNYLGSLAGIKFNGMFRQLGLIILNFGEPVTATLHVGCMLRICKADKILLADSDEFLKADGISKTEEDYVRLEEEEYINDTNSLLAKNLDLVNDLLKNKVVKKVKVSSYQDLEIVFDDEVVIQILPDSLEKGTEYYRYIKFVPHIDDADYKSEHYVIHNFEGRPMLKG